MLKFLPGIIFIQLVTIGLMLMAVNWSHDFQLIIVIAVIAIISAILAAFWFSSIARNIYNDEQAQVLERHAQEREQFLREAEREKSSIIEEKSQLQDLHAREREKMLLAAEREKASITAESYRKIEKETRKAHSRANFKVGMAFAVAAGAGGIMIFSQLVTVGAMLLVASGSGLSGYILRARHERLSRSRQLAVNEQRMISDQSNAPLLEKQFKKDK